jgi:hypothetical protein
VGEAHSVLITAILLPQRLSCYCGKTVSLRMRERERQRVGVVVRDTTVGGVGNNNFRFEGSQALPASPSDMGVN